MTPTKRKRLVASHLEDVSVKLLTGKQDDIRTVLHRQHGLYALYRKDQLYYVGLASNLFTRLKAHTKDRHAGRWDRFSAYVTRTDGVNKELESLALRVLQPDGNRVSGRFAGSTNLKPDLHKAIQTREAIERGELLGGRARKKADRVRRKSASNLKGAARLARINHKRRPLWGEYGGEDFQATLLKNGKIRYEGEDHDSPTAAAFAATGRKRNGFRFWYFKNPDGTWSPLRHLGR